MNYLLLSYDRNCSIFAKSQLILSNTGKFSNARINSSFSVSTLITREGIKYIANRFETEPIVDSSLLLLQPEFFLFRATA